MEKPIIEVKNIGKEYNITHQRGGYIALRDVLVNTLKSPFSFLKTKAKQIAGLETREEFWALKDINFTVNKGEVVGIIGRNGAGKSTLLKILSQITPPTTGEIKIHGRVGSLLEVGTGFHPELTGRENIFLNGAILGMTKNEIIQKFDAIVEFAGIEKFLDTPVKHYSSGMYVRLAFSVAAHMEPDILIIDEVLAVGDAEFQKKCLGKMDEITKKDGRTILFVSHNMGAIQSLCKKTILLEAGRVKMYGETEMIISSYSKEIAKTVIVPLEQRRDRIGNRKLKITDIILRDKGGNKTNHLICGENAEICVKYDLLDQNLSEFDFSIGIDLLPDHLRVALISSIVFKKKVKVTPKKIIKIELKKIPFNIGDYQFTIFTEDHGDIIDWVKEAGEFSVQPGFFYSSGGIPSEGNMLVEYNFKYE